MGAAWKMKSGQYWLLTAAGTLFTLVIVVTMVMECHDPHLEVQATRSAVMEDQVKPVLDGYPSSPTDAIETSNDGTVNLVDISLGESGEDVLTNLLSTKGVRSEDVSIGTEGWFVTIIWHDQTRTVRVVMFPPERRVSEPYGHVEAVFYSLRGKQLPDSMASLTHRLNTVYPRSSKWSRPGTFPITDVWCVPTKGTDGGTEFAQLYFVAGGTLALEQDGELNCF